MFNHDLDEKTHVDLGNPMVAIYHFSACFCRNMAPAGNTGDDLPHQHSLINISCVLLEQCITINHYHLSLLIRNRMPKIFAKIPKKWGWVKTYCYMLLLQLGGWTSINKFHFRVHQEIRVLTHSRTDISGTWYCFLTLRGCTLFIQKRLWLIPHFFCPFLLEI